MSNLIDVKVPDIGDFTDVPVIEIFVKPGDSVKVEEPLIALESDKATMEVPAPQDGVVKSVVVKIGDKVSEGAVILQLEGAGAAHALAQGAIGLDPGDRAFATQALSERGEWRGETLHLTRDGRRLHVELRAGQRSVCGRGGWTALGGELSPKQ